LHNNDSVVENIDAARNKKRHQKYDQ